MDMARNNTRLGPQNVVKQLRQLRSYTERERTGTFYVEGARIVAQALQSGAEIEFSVIAPGLLKGAHAFETVAALRAHGAPVVELSNAAFESISFKENLQGIGALIRRRPETLKNVQMADDVMWVALDNVGNPGNLGAIMRTCDATGCAGLFLLGKTTDPYHPAAIRASMGSFFALRMIRADFAEFIQWKTETGYVIVGTSPTAPQEYREVRYPASCVLLMGSERLGLSVAQQEACDQLVNIPMVGTCDSLNLGVATSIILYEMFHQRRQRASLPEKSSKPLGSI
jgi:RNA methyltransferase, TrmH family